MNPVAKTLWFIESHLADAVTLADIAEAARVSRYHMLRAFGVSTGFSVMRYVRARRLTEAARALANGAPDILNVALEAGYNSHEAFTRAFRDHFGLTPEATRAAGSLQSLNLVEPIRMNETSRTALTAPRIETGPKLLIAGLGEHVTFETLGILPGLWQRFRAHPGYNPGQVAYGVCYNTDEAGFDYIAGTEVSATTALPPDFASIRIVPRRYAVFTHTDHVSTVRGTFVAIFNDWLPTSGHFPDDAPTFERYDGRFDPRTGTGGFEIWIAIKA